MIDVPNGDPKTWQVGDCKVTRIIEMETIGGQTWIMPQATKEVVRSVDWLCPHFADKEGRMKFAIQLMVVDAPGVRIAVDTCVGNDKARPLPHWHLRSGPFLEHLEKAGITTDSVTHVFCTHLHTDHIGWNTRLQDGKWVPTFPKAQYLFGKTEFEYWSGGGTAGENGSAGEGSIHEELADSIQPIIDAGLARFVATDHTIVDEAGNRIYLRPTPGHTPGHASLMIESQGARAIITGDCFHHPLQLTKISVGSRADTDSAQAVSTRQELLEEFCGTPTLLFGTHFARPTVGVVVPHAENFRLDVDVGANDNNNNNAKAIAASRAKL
ncbi:unnamed protein product [Polarella glacialis]|uniref:Metallo-beta-lactamase domain-containing protein n=2 Tax=Polarella glacialis TaxID=89957 RepID=A0A813J184_POLGL|nr:unnamed protein product [Polarella glacialis]